MVFLLASCDGVLVEIDVFDMKGHPDVQCVSIEFGIQWAEEGRENEQCNNDSRTDPFECRGNGGGGYDDYGDKDDETRDYDREGVPLEEVLVVFHLYIVF